MQVTSVQGIIDIPRLALGIDEYDSLPLVCFLGLESVFSVTPLDTAKLRTPEFDNEPEPPLSCLSLCTTDTLLRKVVNVLAVRNHATHADVLWYLLALHNQYCHPDRYHTLPKGPIALLHVKSVDRPIQALPEGMQAMVIDNNIHDKRRMLAIVGVTIATMQKA